jgi:hypothetical protein
MEGFAVRNSLQDLLQELLLANSSNNPAYKFLLSDYAKYHFVMVVLGSAYVFALILISSKNFRLLFKNRNFLANAKTPAGKANLFLGAYTGFLAFLFGLIVIGNFGNAINPKLGLKNSLELLGSPRSGSSAARLQQSFADWIQSEKRPMPGYIRHIVDQRLEWQLPKAIICSLLLVLFLYISKRVWGLLLDSSGPENKRSRYFYFASGFLLSLITTLLSAMAIANTQGSLAPVALTLFFT